ncbi:MAG: hypothetical protein NZ580_02510 [Bacteroidia bacterium]|nr:hypothetical protein [Bacteroidia bacterium]
MQKTFAGICFRLRDYHRIGLLRKATAPPPLLPNTTPENKARNRRVEFILEIPPEKLMLLRLDHTFGDEWELPLPMEGEGVIPIDPEFQWLESELIFDASEEIEVFSGKEATAPSKEEEEEDDED